MNNHPLSIFFMDGKILQKYLIKYKLNRLLISITLFTSVWIGILHLKMKEMLFGNGNCFYLKSTAWLIILSCDLHFRLGINRGILALLT